LQAALSPFAFPPRTALSAAKGLKEELGDPEEGSRPEILEAAEITLRRLPHATTDGKRRQKKIVEGAKPISCFISTKLEERTQTKPKSKPINIQHTFYFQ
jgi:hypothetical protein